MTEIFFKEESKEFGSGVASCFWGFFFLMIFCGTTVTERGLGEILMAREGYNGMCFLTDFLGWRKELYVRLY